MTDPKPENETAGKLSPTGGYGSLDENQRRTNAEERVTPKNRLCAPCGKPRGVKSQLISVARWVFRRRLSTAGSGASPGLGLSELRELRQLREENRKLKTLVADLTLG